MPALLGDATSPYVRKVRMVLLEKNVPYEMVEVSTGDPDSMLPEVNPLGKIPALLTDDELSVYDSRVIVEYLDTMHPEPALLPPAGIARVSVKRWEALADGICDAALAIVYENRREQAQRSVEWMARQMDKITRGIRALAAEIGEREFCSGNRLTVADLAVMAALGYLDLRIPVVRWRQFPELAAYYQRHAGRRSFVETAPPTEDGAQ